MKLAAADPRQIIGKVDLAAPRSEWDHLGRYTTQEACQAGRHALEQEDLRELGQPEGSELSPRRWAPSLIFRDLYGDPEDGDQGLPATDTLHLRADLLQIRGAQCVATADPRPWNS